jgi:hypothetical protein
VSDFDDEPTATGATDEGVDADVPAKRPPAKASKSRDDDWDDDWDDEDEDGRGGRRDMTLIYAIAAAAIVIVLAVVLTRPKDNNNDNTGTNGGTAAPQEIVKNWPLAVGDAVGNKGVDAQARVAKEKGVYIWTDFYGWHVRSNYEEPVVVTVEADTIVVKDSDDYDDKNEKKGAATVNKVDLQFPAGNGATGQGFDLASSEKVTFTITANGTLLDKSQIKLGGGSGEASGNPFDLIKG